MFKMDSSRVDAPRKSRVKTWWKRVRRERKKVGTGALFLILLPLFFVDAALLRADHIKMTELRTAVLVADEGENDEEIYKKLDDLREFVVSNMVINVTEENGIQKITFGTGVFYLEHQYLRAANKALAEAEANLSSDANPNGNIYALASAICKPQAINNGWTWDNPNFINCMLSEIQKYPATDNLESQMMANLPSTELYRHNYASPIWAPTLTGWLILITLIIIVVIFIRLFVWIVLRVSLLFL